MSLNSSIRGNQWLVQLSDVVIWLCLVGWRPLQPVFLLVGASFCQTTSYLALWHFVVSLNSSIRGNQWLVQLSNSLVAWLLPVRQRRIWLSGTSLCRLTSLVGPDRLSTALVRGRHAIATLMMVCLLPVLSCPWLVSWLVSPSLSSGSTSQRRRDNSSLVKWLGSSSRRLVKWLVGCPLWPRSVVLSSGS